MRPRYHKILKNRLPLIALLCLLIIPRIGLAVVGFVHPDAAILPDSEGYLVLAESLETTGRFQASEHIENIRTPIYPVFLAVIRAVFGESIGFAILFQLLISLVTAWLIWRQAGELLGPKAGLAAVWLYTFNPNALFWASTVMSETLFAFWLTLTSYLSVRGLREKSNGLIAVSGLALSLAVLTKPVAIYLIPLWGLSLFVFSWGRTGFHPVFKLVAVFLICALIPVLTWQTRNVVVHGRFFLSGVGSATFSNYIVGYVLVDAMEISREEAVGLIAEAEDPIAYSFDVIRQYPMSALRVTGRGLLRTFLGTEVGLWLPLAFDLPYRESGLLSAVFSGDWAGVTEAMTIRVNAAGDVIGNLLLIWGVGYSILLYGLVGRGLIELRRLKSSTIRFTWFLLAASTAYLLMVPLSNGDARFRLPAEPWLAILGGMAYADDPQKSNSNLPDPS